MHYSGFLRTMVVSWLKLKSKFTKYGYFGNFSTWEEAEKESAGYQDETLIEKVKKSSLLVKNGKASFERDGIAFNEEFKWDVLPWLEELLEQKGALKVLDFGGALGTHYYPLAKLFGKERLSWTIIEQEAFVEIGKQDFQDEHLRFVPSIQEALTHQPDLIILGCVLPYLSHPYEVLDRLKASKIPYILIDKHPVISGETDRVTIQRISPEIYEASYPAWFFSESKFKKFMSDRYDLDKSLTCSDIFNVNSYFKSYFYKLKE